MSAPVAAPWPPRSDDAYRQQAEAVLGPALADRFAAVDLLVLDADGVLTSGAMYYGPRGEALKAFHSHDGLGLVMARVAGLKRAVLTGRDSAIVARRCAELRFDAVKLGRFDKLAALAEILQETGCAAGRTLYVGDDLIDVPAMDAVGLAVCVPAAPAEVRERCAWTTAASGGQGAVREVTDLVLKASGRYGLALTRLADQAWRPTPPELASDETGQNPPQEIQ
ncbi:MAG: HAD hydrolase family protein [Krumholzibacteria bacterium]|nr:HAD hydrolase family protein [Candidatus Krumholzibacteria bacterium]